MNRPLSEVETLTITSSVGGFIALWFSDFITSNINWIIIISLFVFLDTMLGAWKGFILNRFGSKYFQKLFTKAIIYATIVLVAHGMKYASAEETSELAKTFLAWVKESLLIGVLVREALSILEKAGAIWPGSVPVWIRKKLADFDENGNLIIDIKPDKPNE